MKFVAEDASLTIKLEGWERIWSLRQQIVIPRDKIISLNWSEQFATPERELRMGGTGLPRVLYAGSWRGNGRWYFLYLHHPQGYPLAGNLRAENVLALTLEDYPYAEIWLTCKPDIGEQLAIWWRPTKTASLN